MSQLAGWEAIQAAVQRLYGSQEPYHYGTVMRYSEGGPDPLDGISVYRGQSPDYWHYISFGFSELDARKSDRQAESGWGFELSFRLGRQNEKAPPAWVLGFLQQLARYVYNTQSPFDESHYIQWGGTITGDEHTNLVALIFSLDPILTTLDTPNGTVKFLRPIGLTSCEYHFADKNGSDELLARLLSSNPLGIVDLRRQSVLDAL
jgi:hypothetical protein